MFAQAAQPLAARRRAREERFGLFYVVGVAYLVAATLPGLRSGVMHVGGLVTVKIPGAVLTLLLLPRIVRLLRDRATAAALAMLAALGLMAVTSPHASMQHCWLYGVGVTFVLLIAASAGDGASYRTLSILTAIAMLATVFSVGLGRIFEAERVIAEQAGRTGSLTGIAGHYIEYAACAVAAMPLGLALALSSRRRVPRVIWGVLAVVSLAAGLTSGSRGGALAALVCVAVFGGLLVWLRPRRLNWVLIGAAAAMVAFCVPWATVMESLRPVFDRKAWGELPSLRLRLAYLKMGYAQWQSAPVLGTGLGSLKATYGPGAAYHSAWLQTLAELGLTGFAVSLALVGLLGVYAVRTLRHLGAKGAGGEALLLAAWLSVFAAYLAWGVVENIGLVLANRELMVAVGFVLAGSRLGGPCAAATARSAKTPVRRVPAAGKGEL